MSAERPSIRMFIVLTSLLMPLLCAAVRAASAPDGDSVTGYHGGDDRSGQYVVPGLTWQSAARLRRDTHFDGRVDGHVYAQPLYWHPPGAPRGLLIVATESNTVYALDAASGAVVWRTPLGEPVRGDELRCGNIDPLGITGTPVIDAATGTLYLDAMVHGDTGPAHRVYGLSLHDGTVQPGWPVDVAAGVRAHGERFDAALQNQRGALMLAEGRLFVPFGGHFGDCGDYHGWVIAVRLDKPGVAGAWRTRGSKGGIWAPGGIAAAGGALFVSTGNTDGADTWSDGEAVIRLAPDLHRSTNPRDAFAPADWRRLDSEDLDLGGANPMPIALHGRALIVALGKDGNAYLLDRDNLGGIGGALDVRHVSSRPIRTGVASWSTPDGAFVAFQGPGLGCPRGSAAGLTVLRIGAAARGGIGTAWCAALDGAGSPITTTSDGNADRIVWIAGAEGDNRLHGFRADTGAPVFGGGGTEDGMSGLRHFVTFLAAGQRLYVAADGRVYSFSVAR